MPQLETFGIGGVAAVPIGRDTVVSSAVNGLADRVSLARARTCSSEVSARMWGERAAGLIGLKAAFIWMLCRFGRSISTNSGTASSQQAQVRIGI